MIIMLWNSTIQKQNFNEAQKSNPIIQEKLATVWHPFRWKVRSLAHLKITLQVNPCPLQCYKETVQEVVQDLVLMFLIYTPIWHSLIHVNSLKLQQVTFFQIQSWLNGYEVIIRLDLIRYDWIWDNNRIVWLAWHSISKVKTTTAMMVCMRCLITCNHPLNITYILTKIW